MQTETFPLSNIRSFPQQVYHDYCNFPSQNEDYGRATNEAFRETYESYVNGDYSKMIPIKTINSFEFYSDFRHAERRHNAGDE